MGVVKKRGGRGRVEDEISEWASFDENRGRRKKRKGLGKRERGGESNHFRCALSNRRGRELLRGGP